MTTPIKVEQAFAQAVWEALKGDHTDLRKQAMILEAHRTARIAAEAKAFEEAARIADEYERAAGKSYSRAALKGHKVGLKGEQIAAHNIATAIRSRMETDNGR